MKKIILFLLFSVFLSAQKIGVIELKQSIKDKKAFSKSLTLIDNRENKEIGKVTEKEGFGEVKFANEDLKTFIPNWYSEDNKGTGNNDIVLMLEELKIYDEQTPNEKIMFGKAKIKISSFLKRNDKYYLINRFDNVIVCDPRKTSSIVKYLSQNISDVITEFIRASYTNLVLSQYIPENEINNYYSYLIKNNKSLAPELKDGVYLDFKTFSNQEPAFGYFIEKNKKGRFVRMKNKEEIVSLSNAFIYVEAGKAYRFTPVGFLEMKKNEKGFYIIASRAELFAETKTGGVMIGAMAGGIVGAAIGAAIDSGSNKGAMNGFGFKSATMTNVYIDSLTGSFNFEQ
ncbi:hypothetical protein A0O34_09415 [Chryseobacterium glaciei]|uniref:Glycine zipper domain-containing protein n=1 Tax=Chryseobacterium glaciei TaxID=1685010 RepID=A0A172XUN1_9FLAO|nr:hypothetical protein [Chryseobacterium glaciei]ANF50727.1 hypothetical protein A0O34_09415 [Chryseobacterium glaciei]